MNNRIKMTMTLILMLFLTFYIFGCKKEGFDIIISNGSASTETDSTNSQISSSNKISFTKTVIKIPTLETEPYNGDFFTINKPKGWVIETTGDYENFGFRLYDPTFPSKQIFYYGNMKPFTKSDAAKQAWKDYIATGGFSDAQLYADVPVLSPATVNQFYQTFDEFATVALKYGIKHTFPVFQNLEILENSPQNSPMASVAKDDSIIRTLFTSDSTLCEGLFGATVVDSMTSYMDTVDAGYYTVYVITGISAPVDQFSQLQAVLMNSLASFTFKQSYIDQGVSQNKWEEQNALKIGKALSESYDSYNKAWSDRQTANDVLSQKRSDTTLGYERIYDTETGEVYRAETGFFDNYNSNRSQYENPNIQMVPSDSSDLYNKPVSAYFSK